MSGSVGGRAPCGVGLFKYLSRAARLVVLMQTSAVRMERAFSQLKLTLEAIGYASPEKTVEDRLFARMDMG